jgi:hypothetical protein
MGGDRNPHRGGGPARNVRVCSSGTAYLPRVATLASRPSASPQQATMPNATNRRAMDPNTFSPPPHVFSYPCPPCLGVVVRVVWLGNFPVHEYRLPGGGRAYVCHMGCFVYATWP